jgi:phage terminase large subunit-like protein
MFPESGPLSRKHYPRHMEFFAAGAKHRERLFMAANRVGKTEGAGGFEMTMHLTGRYPEWWAGRRFHHPVTALAAGDTVQTVRDILQKKLLGPLGSPGEGLVPAEDMGEIRKKSGVAEAVEHVRVRHASGGESLLYFKSYDQRRTAFQGTELDVVWLDEEPPLDVYAECLLRTMTTGGVLMLTFTPLSGLSDVVMRFLPDGRIHKANARRKGGKHVTMATWDDAPHLSKEQKRELMEAIPPHQRDARSKGRPQLGSGAIYPVPEDDVTVADFAIPEHWPRAFGLDVGWNCTAAVWGAWDRESDILYLYAEHTRGQAEPEVHAAAIRAKGAWIPGAVDPASRGRSQHDGTRLIEAYRGMGLKLIPADNAVEAGIHKVLQRLSSGRLKVFRSLAGWLGEFRLYRRDDDGRVVKKRDHLMDATRYLVMTGMRAGKTRPGDARRQTHADGGFRMGRDEK